MSGWSDDGVRERHGVECREGDARSAVTICEREDYVLIERSGDTRQLTPAQARYLAAKLYRLSRRIRQRNDAQSATLTDTQP